MKQLSIIVVLALAAACHSKSSTPAGPTTPPSGKVKPAHVNDPTIVCRGGEAGRTVFSIELGYPDGCAPIPTEPGGQAHALEVTLAGAPITGYFMNPVDLTVRSVAWEPKGCGAAIVYTGAIGTLELEVAPLEYGGREIGGTARWTATGGAACDLKVSGTYSDYGNDTGDDDDNDDDDGAD